MKLSSLGHLNNKNIKNQNYYKKDAYNTSKVANIPNNHKHHPHFPHPHASQQALLISLYPGLKTNNFFILMLVPHKIA